MSLAARLTFVVIALLGLCGAAVGMAFYGSTRRALQSELDARLEARMLWLTGALEVNDGALQLEAGSEPSGAAEYWQVAIPGGEAIRASDRTPDATNALSRSRTLSFDHHTAQDELPLEQIPQVVRLVLQKTFEGIELRRAERNMRGTGVVFRVEGSLGEKDYDFEVEVTSFGTIRSVEGDFKGIRNERRTEILLSEVPEAVLETARQQLGEISIDDIQRDVKNNQVVYTVDAESGDGAIELEIAEDGRLLEREVDVEPAQLPAEVKEAIGRIVGDVPVKGIERKTRGGQVVYEVEARSERQEIELQIEEDGTILELETESDEQARVVPLSEVPRAVRETIELETRGVSCEVQRKIREGRMVYEVSAEIDGKNVEVDVFEDGTIRNRQVEVDLTDLPDAARAAITRAIGETPVDNVRKVFADREVIYEIVAEAGGQEIELQIGQDGTRMDAEAEDRFPQYRLPSSTGPLEVLVTVGTSTAPMEQKLSRLARTLWTVGPGILVVAGVLLALLVSWQLKPLARIAQHATRIGPESASERLGPAGTSRECVKLRDAINAMLERLDAGLERERRFASSAAHELRSPLAQLRTTVEVALRKERDAEEYRDALSETLTDLSQLEKLVMGLLQLTRSQDPASVRGRPVSLLVLLRKAEEELGPVQLTGGEGGDLTVEGDEELLRAAIGNVLENAARYAPGEVPSMRLEVDGNYVRLLVADRGPGVPEADRECVFEPLTRLDEARTTNEDSHGFGLGLTVARATARAFGGDLTCRGRSDGTRGAEFVFTFRRAARPEDPVKV